MKEHNTTLQHTTVNGRKAPVLYCTATKGHCSKTTHSCVKVLYVCHSLLYLQKLMFLLLLRANRYLLHCPPFWTFSFLALDYSHYLQLEKYVNISGSHNSTAGDSSPLALCLNWKSKALPSSEVSGTTHPIVSYIRSLELYSGVPPPPSGFGRTLGFHKTSSAVPPEKGE